MIKTEFIRYIKSPFNILFATILSLPVIISYYMTFLDKVSLGEQLFREVPPVDLNIEAATIYYEEAFNGMAYLSNFLFSPDYYIIFVIILLIGFGVQIGAVTYRNVKSGFGSTIVSRIPYKKYIKNIFVAQLLYVVTFILGYFSLLFVISHLIWGGYSEVNASMILATGLEYYFFILSHILVLIIYVCLIMLLTSSTSFIISNKYLLQTLPVLLYIIPFILASLLGTLLFELGSSLYEWTWYFASDTYLLGIYFVQATNYGFSEKFFIFFTLPATLFVILVVSLLCNINRYEKSYL